MKKHSPVFIRILCLVLCFNLLTAYAPPAAAVQADTGFYGENLTWTLDHQGTLTIFGVGDMETCVQGFSPWYDQRTLIQRVVISYGITGIGAYAFDGCHSLSSAVIPASVTHVDNWAFSNCEGLTEVSLPEGVSRIGYGAFYGCSALRSVALPDSLTQIDAYAFSQCAGLNGITIPKGVAEIGDGAFSDCSALQSVHFCGNAPKMGNFPFAGVKSQAFYPEGNETWTRAAMQSCGGKLTWSVYGGAEYNKFNINLAQAVLGNALNLYFLFPADAYPDWTGCYAVITKTFSDGRGDLQITVPAGQWEDKASGNTMLKRVGFYNISAKEMGDEIRIVVYDAQGNAISHPGSDSLSSYLIRMLGKNNNGKFRRLAVDMLNYGAAAQIQFRYNTGNLVNAGLTEAQKTYGTTTAAACENKQVKDDVVRGISVSLDNNIVIKVYFTGQTADMTAEVTFVNHAGKTIIKEAETVRTANGLCFQVSQIAVADMRTMVTVTAYDVDGNFYGSVTDSVEGYVARTGSEKAINQAILRFSDSAYAYLH